MASKDYSRRDFHKLSAAALGGMMSIGALGCGGEKPATTGESAETTEPASSDEVTSTVAKHACRGLNECKGQGVKGSNECAGAGTCATIEHHICGGRNECKGQGGCGKTPGFNECKGKGGCHIPMSGGMWKKARELFEERMKEKGVELKPAPEAAA
ncbi:twin-arginine translocation signal domain-containing protein [Bremerella cremea]|uniref:twin-arginine translocation signal domain-containing protein n=1 Tax=Bremerella cremea TaxID=1031537 RepID=UPI0031E7585F